MKWTYRAALALAICPATCGFAMPASPASDWSPDYIYRGEPIDAWQRSGDVEWRVDGDEIIASPKPGSRGGILLLDKSLQDVAVFAEIRCDMPCSAGLLTRTAITGDGMLRGTLFRQTPGESGLADVRIAGPGGSTAATPLPPTQVQSRFETPPGGSAAGLPPSVPGVDSPLRPIFPKVVAPVMDVPQGDGDARSASPVFAPPAASRAVDAAAGFRPGEWNSAELLVDANVARASLNGGRRQAGVTQDDAAGFGPVALYVGEGSGEVRFRRIAYKDLGAQRVPAEVSSPRYRMRKLDDFSYAWDTAVADIDRDGHKDLVAGPYYYLGPDFIRRRELYIASTYSPGTQYAGNMITHAHDFTGDGWPDVLVTEGRQMALLVNPQGAPRRWDRHMVVPGNISELTMLADLDGDGRPELLLVQAGRVSIAQPRPGAETEPWPIFFVSDPGAKLHGFGVGDIDGDGRPDIVQPGGWWRQPANGLFARKWEFHSFLFGNPEHPDERVEGGGEMAVVDVNGDGLADVISSVNAHGFGLAWYEQTRVDGRIGFTPHLIMGDYRRDNPGGLAVSQLHAGAVAADVDGDGVIDFVTGKKRWAHLDSHADPDPASPAYLLLYRGVRDRKAPGGVRFIPEILSNRAGVGSALTVTDIDGDGKADVATSGVNGTYIFLSRKGRN